MPAGAARASLRGASPRTPSRGRDGRRPSGRPAQRLERTALDVLLDSFARAIVGDLTRRRLHEVRRRSDDRAAETAIESELAAAYGVDHHAGAVRRVPDLELDLRVERHVTEGRALHADVAPLAVEQPRDVVRGSDVDVLLLEWIVEHARDRVRLADLLRLEPLALEHIEEVGVPAEIELVRAVQPHPAIHEEPREDAVRDRRADL